MASQRNSRTGGREKEDEDGRGVKFNAPNFIKSQQPSTGHWYRLSSLERLLQTRTLITVIGIIKLTSSKEPMTLPN